MQILVEGKADEKFVGDFMCHIGIDLSAEDRLIVINGYTALPKFRNEIKREHDFGGMTLVMFDADLHPDQKRVMVARIESELSVSLPLFLFPNNRDAGTLEDLLAQIVNPSHQGVLVCFDRYQECLAADESHTYTLPDKKAMIYAYCEAVLPASEKQKIKEENRDYLDTQLWNLDSHSLQPFRDFLVNYVAT